MRVIAGRLRGRPLRAPRGSGTRPTSDRVREALFSILGDLTDARVLDLYAGTGALGIEALSRGAQHACFVDHHPPAIAVITENLRTLGLEAQSQVLRVRAERAGARLAGEDESFDLVLCDPPWAEVGRVPAVLDDLRGRRLLRPGCRVSVEHPAREPLVAWSPDWALVDQRRYGDTGISLLAPGPRSAADTDDVR